MRWLRTACVLFCAGLLLGSSGCRRFSRLRHKPVHRAVRGPRLMAPLPMSMRVDKIETPHFESAAVFVPLGTRWARPVVIAIHGQNESPEMACNAWSSITNRDYFVLCPEIGVTRSENGAKASCNSVECLADELREALVALRQRFGRYVAPKEVMLAGRASGAARAVPIALQNPAVFSAVWLVDGGLREWSSAVSVAYATRGGKFVGLACEGSSCESEAQRVRTSAGMAGLLTAFVNSGSGGSIWAAETVKAVRLSWQRAKPAGWPWSVPGRAEHSTRPDG